MPQIETIIHGEWHWISALLAERLPVSIHGTELDTIPPLQDEGAVFHAELWDATNRYTWPDGVMLIGLGVGRYLRADIIVREKGDAVTITITCERDEDVEKFEGIIQEVGHSAMRARMYKQDSYRITAEWIIERYYRRRARGNKITLRELAKQYGFSESYLSQAKKKYDQAGKWGSKPKKSSEKT